MNRRILIKSTLSTLAACAAGCKRSIGEVPQLQSLSELCESLRAGYVTTTDLLKYFLSLNASVNRAGPMIRAVIDLNPDSRLIAERLDIHRSTGRSHGPLHGQLVLVKDNIDSADRLETTAGSLCMIGQKKPARDATVVTKLRAAGMLIAGKTNLSEWANMRSPESTSGWSPRGGVTRNPHKPTHSASGSSSGSAAAVAAGLVGAAIGTETNGSIVSPASACGIVGLKPTLGAVSRAGIIPITHWQDTAGPMTLTVQDAAMLMNAIAGTDELDPATGISGPARIPADYTALLKPEALHGVRLGVVRSMSGHNASVITLLERALEILRKAGAEIVEIPTLPNEKEMGPLSMSALLTEFRADLNTYLEARGARIKSLTQLIAYNKAHHGQEMPYFGQEFFEEADRRGTPEALAEAAQIRAKVRAMAGPDGIDSALATHRVDALVCATNDPPGPINLAHGDFNVRCASTPAAVAGYPHLTVPMGFVDGLPIGLSFMGTAWSDPQLLAYGHAFQVHGGSPKPLLPVGLRDL